LLNNLLMKYFMKPREAQFIFVAPCAKIGKRDVSIAPERAIQVFFAFYFAAELPQKRGPRVHKNSLAFCHLASSHELLRALQTK